MESIQPLLPYVFLRQHGYAAAGSAGFFDPFGFVLRA